MPALLTPKALLESLIHRVHPVLLFQIAELDICVVLDEGDCFFAAFLEVFLICIEPGLDRRIVRYKVPLTKIDFHVSDEIACASDQNGVDEKDRDASDIMQQFRRDNISTEELRVQIVLDFLSCSAIFNRACGLTTSHASHGILP